VAEICALEMKKKWRKKIDTVRRQRGSDVCKCCGCEAISEAVFTTVNSNALFSSPDSELRFARSQLLVSVHVLGSFWDDLMDIF